MRNSNHLNKTETKRIYFLVELIAYNSIDNNENAFDAIKTVATDFQDQTVATDRMF